jgi:hypothetical protein
VSSLIDGKSKKELLTEFDENYVKPENKDHQIIKQAILVKCTEDIEHSINSLEKALSENAKSSQSLAIKVFYLNIILAIATIMGTIFAIAQFFCNRP